MNVDDPRLTAYALGEVSDEEKAEIEKLVAGSPEAQRFVNETQDFVERLKAEYAADTDAETSKPANLVDIRDDPWFWSVGRPLAIAAALALLGLVAAVLFATYRVPRVATNTGSNPVEIETEVMATSAIGLPFRSTIPNPLPVTSIQEIQRVVIGELIDPQPGGEMHTVEIISDAYRLRNIRQRLSTPMLTRIPNIAIASRIYRLEFLDAGDKIVAVANFFQVSDGAFVLQLVTASDATARAGEGKIDPDYVIPFADWLECVGYAPSV